MKILSRMLSRKIEPQAAEPKDIDEDRLALDDAGRINPSRDPMFAKRAKTKPAPTEEPEVAGNGWAESDDWEDDWDDEEDWGDEDLAAMDVEERRRTQDKEHLVSEIREAMTSVTHVQPDEKRAAPVVSRTPDWSDDEDFGRRARARSQLTAAAADEAEDRLLEQTETAMSDRETSRRRSAMAHMKVAAAATKADRVLRHVASRDPSADPEEQSPYRDDLAKVVRPNSKSRPISRQVSRPNAPSPVWDQGAGDEDAALFAASAEGLGDDLSVEEALAAAEEERLKRAPAEMSEADFGEGEEDRTDFSRNAFGSLGDGADDDFDDDFEDEIDDDDDFAPRPSSVVAEAVAFANAPDEEVDMHPESEVRKKIWEMADQVSAEVSGLRATRPTEPPAPLAPAESQPAAHEPIVNVAPAVTGRAGRSAGRVKTRLLGFQTDQDQTDVFAAKEAAPAAAAAADPARHTMFPAGWIVVIDGPGRGACFTLVNGVCQIGRGEDQAVRLDFGDTSISRNNHAAVAYDDEQGKFFLGHGGKSNLVRLNGMPVLSTEELSNGDQIRIGETTLKFVALCGDDFTWAGQKDDDAENE